MSSSRAPSSGSAFLTSSRPPSQSGNRWCQGSQISRNTGEGISLRTTKNQVEIGKDTLDWLTTVYTTSRGFELGTFDSSLLAMTMKTQSFKLEGLALGYVSDGVILAHSFIISLLRLICPDVRTHDGHKSVLLEELRAKYLAAFDHARFTSRERGTPATENDYFSDNWRRGSHFDAESLYN